ncbi:MAG: TenA family protein [Planctomycetota bacterium]|jgi:thiaminase/transcriptional activator TenA
MLSHDLWEANVDLADACLNHPFVRGLADGSLGVETFKRYVAQDAFFLESFLRAYALAAARCTDPDHARTLHGMMEGALEELKLHASYAGSLGIDLDAVRPQPAAKAYTDFLRRSAWHDGLDVTLAAMTPCMRLYAWIGQRLAPHLRVEHPYADWIRTYSSEDFEKLARSLETLLDAVATDNVRVRRAYRYAMACELDFFGAP